MFYLFLIFFIYKLRTQCHTIIAETVQNNNRHWRRPTQVLKHLRVACGSASVHIRCFYNMRHLWPRPWPRPHSMALLTPLVSDIWTWVGRLLGELHVCLCVSGHWVLILCWRQSFVPRWSQSCESCWCSFLCHCSTHSSTNKSVSRTPTLSLICPTFIHSFVRLRTQHSQGWTQWAMKTKQLKQTTHRLEFATRRSRPGRPTSTAIHKTAKIVVLEPRPPLPHRKPSYHQRITITFRSN